MTKKEILTKMEALAEITLRLDRKGIDTQLLSHFYAEEYEHVFKDTLFAGYEEHIAPRSTNNGENMGMFNDYCLDAYLSEISGMFLSLDQTKHHD